MTWETSVKPYHQAVENGPPERQQDVLDAVARRVGKTPEYIGAAFVALSGLAGAFATLAEGTARALWITCAVILVLVFLGVAASRERLKALTKRETDDEIETLRQRVAGLEQQVSSVAVRVAEEWKEDLEWIIKDRLGTLLHLVAETFAEPARSERLRKARETRMAILTTASEIVGRAAVRGTRANLFLLKTDSDGMEYLELAPSGFYGRGDRSTRRFLHNSPTLEATLSGQTRFVEDTGGVDDDTGASLEYETYMTHPVREGTGTIYGALTVDCKSTGDLNERIDLPLMSVLSVMIALTYRAESTRPASSST